MGFCWGQVSNGMSVCVKNNGLFNLHQHRSLPTQVWLNRIDRGRGLALSPFRNDD